ncbi:DnaJ domain-containing protein [Paenibacillus frigoriresistens]|uniref:DnaJ domain-containing protein n=1 Tax=Paenibacillus alginolyticus TaxID=59839 RepID=UPI0015670E9A|nr:DnaJ domain-containing protein [Paenibacillus frigoriresistens]NRF89855.1 DnaJ domain-containing protein [Paenibacillus frigoriresistens]
MSLIDLYEVLGLSKAATAEEIKKAYRKKAKESHPDVGGKEENFKTIKEAYDVLSDPKMKSEYDYAYNLYHSYTANASRFNNQHNVANKEPEKATKSSVEEDNIESPPTPIKIFRWKVYHKVLAAVIVLFFIFKIINWSTNSSSTNTYVPQIIDQQNISSNQNNKQQSSPITSPIPIIRDVQTRQDVHPIPTIETTRKVDAKIEEHSKEENDSKVGKLTFTLGSTKEEVRKAMGEPKSLEKYPSVGEVWRYGLSSINFNTNGIVDGWSFMKKGEAYLGDKKSNELTFTLDSTKQEVIDAMGTPDSVEKYPSVGDVWRYGLSSVNFNTKGKVDGWSFMKKGEAFLGIKKAGAPRIKEGSSKQDVLDSLGTPDTIENYPFVGNVWRYGLSSVDLDTSGKVTGWSNL